MIFSDFLKLFTNEFSFPLLSVVKCCRKVVSGCKVLRHYGLTEVASSSTLKDIFDSFKILESLQEYCEIIKCFGGQFLFINLITQQVPPHGHVHFHYESDILLATLFALVVYSFLQSGCSCIARPHVIKHTYFIINIIFIWGGG